MARASCAPVSRLPIAALSLPAPAVGAARATRNLAEELERQILPDGGHVSRNPMAVMELLADLLPLRQTYANQAEAPPDALIGAVERMLPALRFFRHGDGSLAHFNGMGVTIHERVAAILRHDDTAGAPLLHAPHSGYERLAMGGTVSSPIPACRRRWRSRTPPMPAACRSNCRPAASSSSSMPASTLIGADEFRPLGRATAAHSTACVNDTSSARFNHSGRVSGISARR